MSNLNLLWSARVDSQATPFSLIGQGHQSEKRDYTSLEARDHVQGSGLGQTRITQSATLVGLRPTRLAHAGDVIHIRFSIPTYVLYVPVLYVPNAKANSLSVTKRQ